MRAGAQLLLGTPAHLLFHAVMYSAVSGTNLPRVNSPGRCCWRCNGVGNVFLARLKRQ